jgi:hypothetical protein
MRIIRFVKPKRMVFLFVISLAFLFLSASSLKAEEVKKKKNSFSIYGSLYFNPDSGVPVAPLYGISLGHAFSEKVAFEMELNGFRLIAGWLVGNIVYNIPTDGGSTVPYLAGGVGCLWGHNGNYEVLLSLDVGGGVKCKLSGSTWFRLDMTFFFAGGGYAPRVSTGLMWAF